MARMTEEELRMVVEQEVSESTTWANTELAGERERNLNYYHGKPMGNEVTGRSQVVSWDVFEVVESALPALLEPFFAGDNIGEFEPMEQGDEKYAEQATDYINWLIKKKNDGFITFNTWIKDGCLSKVGIVRAWWDATNVTRKATYKGLTDAQLAGFTNDASITILTHDAEDDPDDAKKRQEAEQALPTLPPEQQQQVAQMLAGPAQQLHEISVIHDKGPRGVRIDNVPPESFILSRRAKKVADVSIIGELREYTRSDLVSMGFKQSRVAELSDYDVQGSHLMIERNDNASFMDDPADEAMQPVAMFFGFVRVDFDGDGIAEWRRVFMAGNDILENEEVDDHEYCLWSPIMLPHRIIGMSLADPVASIQDTKTSLQRQYLDSLYIANNPATYALDGKVNLDDLLSNRIGRVIRMKEIGAVGPLQTTLVANESLQGIELANTMREERIGVTRYSQGLDADSLNKTATGVNAIMSAGERRQKMMLRIFAETGVKDLFKRVLKLTCMYQDKPATIRLRNEWVEYDPRNWSDEMDVASNVGLGSGDKTETIGFLNLMGTYFQQAASLGIVRPKNVYNLGKMLLKAGNIQGGEYNLLTDPDTAEPMPQQESPEQVLAKMELELEDKRQQGKARDAEYKRTADAAELKLKQYLGTLQLQLEEKKVRIAEIELGLKDVELQHKRAESGNAEVEGGAPNALLMIAELRDELNALATAETHIIRDPLTGKAVKSVKVLPQPQTMQEG